MFRKFVLFSCLISFMIARPHAAFAQARDTASLFGAITDAQGAVVPGARVTITNTATGLSRNAATDGSGGFVFPLLPVGSFNLRVGDAGFRKEDGRERRVRANESG